MPGMTSQCVDLQFHVEALSNLALKLRVLCRTIQPMRSLRFFAPLLIAFHASGADVTFNYSFTVSDIRDYVTHAPLPIAPFSGSFGGTFTPIVGTGINSSTLTSFNLVIEGYTYNLGNTGLRVSNGHALPAGNYEAFFSFGGLVGGLDGMIVGTDDFSFALFDSPISSGVADVEFKRSVSPSTIYAGKLTFVRLSSVPDAGTSLTLLTGGLLLLLAARRWSRKAILERNGKN